MVDSVTEKAGFPVLRMPPYHCILGFIEMAWSQLEYVRHLNVYTIKPKSKKYVKKTYPLKIEIKEEEKFRIMDHIINNEIEPFIIHLSEHGDVNDCWTEV